MSKPQRKPQTKRQTKTPPRYYPPTPFLILIDSREQTPLPFHPSVPTTVVKSADGGSSLYPGDYSIDGLRTRFCVERKSLEDLVGTLIGHTETADGGRIYNRDRFIEELTAMRDFDFACVVVTSPRANLETHLYRSRIEPANIIAMIAAIEARTGIQFKFFDSAEQAAAWVAVEALHFWRFANGLETSRVKLRPARLTPKQIAAPPPPLIAPRP